MDCNVTVATPEMVRLKPLSIPNIAAGSIVHFAHFQALKLAQLRWTTPLSVQALNYFLWQESCEIF